MPEIRNEKGQFLPLKKDNNYNGYAIYYDRKGYATIWYNGKNMKVHLLEWERNHGLRPNGYEVHHKDENKANWNIANLELLSPTDHQKVHAGWERENGVWAKKPCGGCNQKLPLDKFYQRAGLTPSAKCRECSKKLAKIEARENGVKPRRFISRNDRGEYQCSICFKYKEASKHKKRTDGQPTGCCKQCSNEKQKERRKSKNILNGK